jgi:hypothetical protein
MDLTGTPGAMAPSSLQREIRSLARKVGAIDAVLRSATDPATRVALMERCRALEWRINALATPPPYRVPH